MARLSAPLNADRIAQHDAVATNVGDTYTDRIYTRIADEMDRGRPVPEPVLEHLFSVIRVLDAGGFALPPGARDVKIEIARRLIDAYYEGHSDELKQEALKHLAGIAAG